MRVGHILYLSLIHIIPSRDYRLRLLQKGTSRSSKSLRHSTRVPSCSQSSFLCLQSHISKRDLKVGMTHFHRSWPQVRKKKKKKKSYRHCSSLLLQAEETPLPRLQRGPCIWCKESLARWQHTVLASGSAASPARLGQTRHLVVVAWRGRSSSTDLQQQHGWPHLVDWRLQLSCNRRRERWRCTLRGQ